MHQLVSCLAVRALATTRLPSFLLMSRTKKEDWGISNSSESEVEVLYDKERDRRARRKGQSPRREASKRRMAKEGPGIVSLRPRVSRDASRKFEVESVAGASNQTGIKVTTRSLEDIPLPAGPPPSFAGQSPSLCPQGTTYDGLPKGLNPPLMVEREPPVNPAFPQYQESHKLKGLQSNLDQYPPVSSNQGQIFNSHWSHNAGHWQSQSSTWANNRSHGWGSSSNSIRRQNWGQVRNYSSDYGKSGAWDDLGERWGGLRRWQPSAFGKDMMAGQMDGLNLRVLSYNVLAQNLLQGHPYLYRNSPDFCLKWDYRWEGIRSEVDDLRPDVVCLQEVQMEDPNYFDSSYEPFFSQRGYRHVVKKRTGDKKDGCVIFFKGDKFTLDCVSEMEFNIPRISVLNRDNIGLVCRLTPLDHPALPPVVFATTHLLYNPKRDDIRLAQTALLLAEVDRLATPPVESENRSYLPTIITGDFNCPPTSPVVQLLTTGSVSYRGRRCHGNRTFPDKLVPDALGLSDSCQWQVKLDQRGLGEMFEVGTGGLHHSLDLVPVYPPAPGVSTYQDGWTLVDYILRSSHRSLNLAATLALPSPHQLPRSGGLPSKNNPSDHLPLVADFFLTPS